MEEKRNIRRVRLSEHRLGQALVECARRHADEAGVRDMMVQLAGWCEGHVQVLDALLGDLNGPGPHPSEPLHAALFRKTSSGLVGLLHDLHDLLLLATHVRILWTMLTQAAMQRRDRELSAIASRFGDQLDRQVAWLITQIKTTSPQALTVPPPRRRSKSVLKKNAPIRENARVPTDAGR